MENGPNDYTTMRSTRDSDLSALTMHTDEKNDLVEKQKKRRLTIILIGLALLGVIVVSVLISISVNGSSSVHTESAQESKAPLLSNDDANDLTQSSSPIQIDPDPINPGQVNLKRLKDDSTSTIDQYKSPSSLSLNSYNTSGSLSDASDASLNQDDISTWKPEGNDTSPISTPFSTVPPAQDPTQSASGKALSYSLVDFDWTDPSKWEYASGASVSTSMVTPRGIILTPDNSAEPIRTKEGWRGEKVVYIEWDRSSTSDTNIWMLNTKLQDQFGKKNGWPYWGELDLFEMFTQDARSIPSFDYSGFREFSDVSSYGQLTLHMGPAQENGSPCFCPSSHTKSLWYRDTPSMTSGCTAQFSNDPSNSIAAVWGSDSTGKYLQLIQNPTITMGEKLNGVDTFDVTPGSGAVTSKIYNNAELFWGVEATAACAQAGGHNANTGFPFFESFRLVLEEQKKGDSSASFTVKKIQIFTKNNA